ncbi:uncharacterized protein EDB91DRAFT_229269 [Suillus paluster]|uniref:uncharacterized protein n=1 Tax=Suillus paluster TaxID=48578 RepID=UPI001B86ED47|nr:uncharacterized protein EDB91DRAFT_229269 [Suillus paluster]KAG1721866.1 hypothetical protein EDB91DRAFT_229269 [Suillus paluster]
MHCISRLDDLVDDILIQIFQALSVREILTLRRTSQRYYSLSKLHCVWYAAFCTEVLARHLPPPGPSRSLRALSSADLEYRTLLALSLERRWSRSTANVIVSNRDREIVDQIVLIPGGMQILTVHGNKVVYWLISEQSGASHELQKVGEWSSPSDDACIVLKDIERHGIIAIGCRDQPNRHATMFSLSLEPALSKLCDSLSVPGIVAGVSRHLLFLDTTSQHDEGGLELLDWHAQTEGTALLPRIPDLFGAFLGFVHFSDQILVAWETCISVFPVPDIPTQGRTVVAHTKVFMLSEHISSPIAFTTCVSRGWSGADAPVYAPSMETPSLTIAARGKSGGITLSMLIRLDNDEGAKYASSFPYRLLRLSSFVPDVLGDRERGEGVKGCTQICMRSSGRGLYVFGGKVRLCGPNLLFMPPFEMQFGPEFEMGEAIYEMEAGGDGLRGDMVDFDEGMGRFVVARGSGGFDVIQLL